MRDAQFNVALELLTFALMLGFLVSMGLISLAGFIIVGTEWNDVSGAVNKDLSRLERAAFSSSGYVLTLFIVSIPAVLATLAILGIRLLLIRPEPPPWHPSEPDP